MNRDLVRIALRYNAVYLPAAGRRCAGDADAAALAFAAALMRCGFTPDEKVLRAASCSTQSELDAVADVIDDVMGVHLNWAPLVKAWQTPTGESCIDHIVTLFANLFPDEAVRGTVLPCGHKIPEGTFPLDRYNGCPFCGRPFVLSDRIYTGQGSRLKVLTLWHDEDFMHTLRALLESRVPLDATQTDTVVTLVRIFGLPDDADIAMKETAVAVASALIGSGKAEQARRLFATPQDLLRYLWYVKTGQLRVVAPATLIENAAASVHSLPDKIAASDSRRRELRLHYSRTECRMYASWLDGMEGSAESMCENMNPRRQMWVRFIRALRLPEYARRHPGCKLAEVLDRFYRRDYTVWAGELESARLRGDAAAVFARLKSRPGLFARSLFATMLRFGAAETTAAFRDVADMVEPRLLLTLGDLSRSYFLPDGNTRQIAIAAGRRVEAPVNPLLARYSEAERGAMADMVKELYITAMRERYSRQPHTPGATVYIDRSLFAIPVPVGLRSSSVQDTDPALTGQTFAVEGNAVRLFMQWGKDMPAQHLDMDLSARLVRADGSYSECAYYSLSVPGAVHSGDIRYIPDFTGTAEYVELDLDALKADGVRYAVFTCNAYSSGNVAPGLVVGWMDSRYPMKVSDETGVAYDPSTVARSIRITESNLAKGLVFGVLDVDARSVIWLELPFGGRSVASLDFRSVSMLLDNIRSRTSIGDMLALKADVQQLRRVDSPEEADRAYLTWQDAVGDIL